MSSCLNEKWLKMGNVKEYDTVGKISGNSPEIRQMLGESYHLG